MDLTLKKGTELFHATGEPFNDNELRGGGYDNIIWTTTESAISQTYIPIAGVISHMSTENFIMPSKDSAVINLQKQMGLEFTDVEWKGFRAYSYRVLKTPFADIDKAYWEDRENTDPKKPYINFEKMKLERVNKFIEDNLGYKPEREDSYGQNHSWVFKESHGEILPADYRKKGRLFILIPTQDLKIFDMTLGGSVEGDLTDLDYHKIDLFGQVEKKGYDGIKINDFAQSNDQGNFGHHSVGLFPRTLSKLTKEIIPDVIHHDLEGVYLNFQSPEYKKHRGLNEVRSFIRGVISQIIENSSGQ